MTKHKSELDIIERKLFSILIFFSKNYQIISKCDIHLKSIWQSRESTPRKYDTSVREIESIISPLDISIKNLELQTRPITFTFSQSYWNLTRISMTRTSFLWSLLQF